MRHAFTMAVLLLTGAISNAQKGDSLTILFHSNEYNISRQDENRLDSFVKPVWTSLVVNGHTDDKFTFQYNDNLSRQRAQSVFNYLLKFKTDTSTITLNYFGERSPKVLNSSDSNRSKNRRVEIIRFAKEGVGQNVAAGGGVFSADASAVPVTTTLNNGVIVIYQPGTLPANLENNFKSKSGENFNLITSVRGMQDNNILTNTDNGGVLSSVLICCFDNITPCRLDSPFTVKFPITTSVICPLNKIKFLFSKIEAGKKIWQEQSKQIYPEIIDGKLFISLRGNDFCDQCINFDFKIEPDCFETEKSIVEFTGNMRVDSIYVNLQGLNSRYAPLRLKNNVYEILHLRKQPELAILNFSVKDKKENAFAFSGLKMSSLKYDSKKGKYLIDRRLMKKLKNADTLK